MTKPASSALRLARTGEVLDLLRRGAAETTADLAATMGLAVALSRTAPPNDLGAVVFDTPLTPLLRWIPEPVLLAG